MKTANSIYICLLVMLTFCGIISAQDNSPYEKDYEIIKYGSVGVDNAVNKLQARLSANELTLQFSNKRGYLDSVLEALDISTTSQILVFSKTSLQQPLISPNTPRAIYFNDDVYVAWVPKSGALEIGSMDQGLGPIFFTLDQVEKNQPAFTRQFRQCLRCHDSLSLTGGGTPRFMMSSNYTGLAGQLVSHEGSIMTTSRTPIKSRWGGWFVTGSHGAQMHLGNVIVENAGDVLDENLSNYGNRTSLSGLTDIDPYITPYSDIVALMVIEHQIEVQNLITRVNFRARTLLADDQLDTTDTEEQLLMLSEELVRSLFMVGQPELIDPIKGNSGFAEYFISIGKKDTLGRSLRDFDLKTRLFKYPLSYLIHSDAYLALPAEVKDIVAKRIEEILSLDYEDEIFSNLSGNDKTAILEILSDTVTDQ
ncbi:MAG: hypothetical protein P8N40_06170 [Gammaproteobacteria bacterium]|nr:hypothetical protein [Gammaproteobacteria bacterium]